MMKLPIEAFLARHCGMRSRDGSHETEPGLALTMSRTSSLLIFPDISSWRERRSRTSNLEEVPIPSWTQHSLSCSIVYFSDTKVTLLSSCSDMRQT